MVVKWLCHLQDVVKAGVECRKASSQMSKVTEGTHTAGFSLGDVM